MRHFITILTISLLILTGCKSNKASNEKMIFPITKITLSEQTRGTIKTFSLLKGKLVSSINALSETKEVSADTWSTIVKTTEKINLENISKLESPSTKRFSDAALSSIITIEKDGKTYNSSDFDSGNPPAELSELYKKLQEIIATKKSR